MLYGISTRRTLCIVISSRRTFFLVSLEKSRSVILDGLFTPLLTVERQCAARSTIFPLRWWKAGHTASLWITGRLVSSVMSSFVELLRSKTEKATGKKVSGWRLMSKCEAGRFLQTPTGTFKRIAKVDLHLPKWISKEADSLIRGVGSYLVPASSLLTVLYVQLLQYKPQDRLSLDEVLQHPWILKYNPHLA